MNSRPGRDDALNQDTPRWYEGVSRPILGPGYAETAEWSLYWGAIPTIERELVDDEDRRRALEVWVETFPDTFDRWGGEVPSTEYVEFVIASAETVARAVAGGR